LNHLDGGRWVRAPAILGNSLSVLKGGHPWFAGLWRGAEPPIVARDRDESGKYLLLDGHLRIEVLREMGEREVVCLISIDDEAFRAHPRGLAVTCYTGEKGPCPCIADGVMLAPNASPRQGTLVIALEKAPVEMLDVVIVRNRKTGNGFRYIVTDAWLPKVIEWNKTYSAGPPRRLVENWPKDKDRSWRTEALWRVNSVRGHKGGPECGQS